MSTKNEDNQNKERKERNGGRNKANESVQVSIGNIVLGSPTNNSITASIILQKNDEAFIEYGLESSKYFNKTKVYKADADNPLEIVLANLEANTNYVYRLNYRKAGEQNFISQKESWFSTQKNTASTFSFALQGDSHPERQGKMFNPVLYKQTINQVSQLKPDFYFLMGDDFSIDRLIENNAVSSENVETVYKMQRFYLGNSGNNPPLFLVNGNHEQASRFLLNGSIDNAAVQAGLARKKYFPLPNPSGFYSGDKDSVANIGLLKDYYAFEWGNALFVVIDPYWHSDVLVDHLPKVDGEKIKRDPWGATLGKEQYNWLKQTLENSKAKFKFVFAHHVNGTGRGGVEEAKLYEWGGYSKNGKWEFDKYRNGWDLPIHQLFVKNKVTIFFQGHDHIFAKQELDGVIYQSVPNPADDSYTAFNKDAYTSGKILTNSGFLHVTVISNQVKVEYIRSYLNTDNKLSEEVTQSYEYVINK